MHEIPVIDIGPASSRADTLHQIEEACRDIGFMFIRGHGISQQLIESIRTATVRYFERPLEDKLEDLISRDNYRGYIPQGFFSPNSRYTRADRYEGYKLHFDIEENDPIRRMCDLYAPVKWPEAPPQFRKAVQGYWQACDRVAHELLAMLAVILGVKSSWLLELFEKPLTNMTLLHYPPQKPGDAGFGIHPHKDTDALTILAPDNVGGLMVKKRGSEDWLEVNAPGDTLVVNLGDLLELWSGGYFVSTPHKVVNSSGVERYSFPYFAVPRFDTVVNPLCKPQPGYARAAVHVGEVSREVWRTNWPHSSPRHENIDLGTLED